MNSEVLSPELVWTDIQAANKFEALELMSERLQQRGIVSDAQAFLADVLDREASGATGIGNGVAIPHGKSPSVLKDRIAIGILGKPIDWETLDGRPVTTILLFAVDSQRETACNTHLKMMASVAQALAHDNVIDSLAHAEAPADAINALEPYLNKEDAS